MHAHHGYGPAMEAMCITGVGAGATAGRLEREGLWGSAELSAGEGGVPSLAGDLQIGRWERRNKTNRYLYNKWQVGNLFPQNHMKVGDDAFGFLLWKKLLLGKSTYGF